MSKEIESHFRKSYRSFLLWFLDSELEKEYQSHIQLNEEVVSSKIETLLIFIQFLLGIIVQSYEFYLSIRGEKRFQLQNEIMIEASLLVGFIIELIIFFTSFKFLSKVKGCFFILAFYITCVGHSLNIITCYSVSFGDIASFVCSIFIGIAYNKTFLFPSLSVTLGIIIMFIFIIIKATITSFQLIILILSCLFMIFWNGYLFYHSEVTLRRDFFVLQDSKEKGKLMQNILEVVPTPIMTRKDKNITFVNYSLKSLLGITKHEGIELDGYDETKKTKKIEELLQKIKQTETEKSLIKVLEKRRLTMLELSSYNFFFYINNTKLDIRIKGAQFKEYDSYFEVYVIEDVSTLLRIQAETEKKYQKIIIASVAHEILTPTNGGIGVLESLIPLSSSEKMTKKLKLAQKCFVKLIFFTNLLKDYTLVDTTSLTLNDYEVNIIECIDDCVDVVRHDIRKKKLKLKFEYESNIILVHTDKYKFTQIAFSLISNAVKHTFNGSITIGVSYLDNRSNFEFIVEDTGCGIEEENQLNMFKVLADSSSRNELNPQGIGIQLFVCKKMVEFMKGSISFNSIAGKGSKFSVILPRNASSSLDESPDFQILQSEERLLPNILNQSSTLANPISDQPPRPLQLINKTCSCRQYLIVDDDSTNISVLKNYFASIKIECDTAFNGKLAVDITLVQNSKECCRGYKLILMDLNMPVMDGEEATRILKQKFHSNEIHPCNIVAISATQIQDASHKQKFIEAGFIDIYQKPISKKTFLSILTKYG